MRRASFLLLLLLAGCTTVPPEQRTAAAKALFDETTKQYHLPAAQAQGAERDRLLQQAATGYGKLVRHYRDQPAWSAVALRSLGNIRATQGKLDEAVKLYAQVGARYPQQEWEVLQAWKSAADLLNEAGRTQEARKFYQQIVEQFGQPEQPEVVRVIARAARRHLTEPVPGDRQP